jgi:hypothetical protein
MNQRPSGGDKDAQRAALAFTKGKDYDYITFNQLRR